MIRRFERQEKTFKRLVKTIEENPNITENELKWRAWWMNLESIHNHGGSDTVSFDDIFFEVDARPTRGGVFAIYGYPAKGYAYLVEPPHPNFTADNLDLENNGLGYTFHHIKGNWYLYLEVTDW